MADQKKSLEELSDDEMMDLVSLMMQAHTGMDEQELINTLKQKEQETNQ